MQRNKCKNIKEKIQCLIIKKQKTKQENWYSIKSLINNNCFYYQYYLPILIFSSKGLSSYTQIWMHHHLCVHIRDVIKKIAVILVAVEVAVVQYVVCRLIQPSNKKKKNEMKFGVEQVAIRQYFSINGKHRHTLF